jgi:hypothetical protein
LGEQRLSGEVGAVLIPQTFTKTEVSAAAARKPMMIRACGFQPSDFSSNTADRV